MDELRAAHARELTTERQANERLSAKQRRYRDYIDRAQAEWDDMREAMSVVVEKGRYESLRRRLWGCQGAHFYTLCA